MINDCHHTMASYQTVSEACQASYTATPSTVHLSALQEAIAFTGKDARLENIYLVRQKSEIPTRLDR